MLMKFKMCNKVVFNLILFGFLYVGGSTLSCQHTFGYGISQTMSWCKDNPLPSFSLGALALVGLSWKIYHDLYPERLSHDDIHTYIDNSKYRSGMLQLSSNGYFYPNLDYRFKFRPRGRYYKLKDLEEGVDTSDDLEECKKNLVKEYKIHLMPKNSQEFKKTFDILANSFNEKEDFRKVICGFKCIDTINFYKSKWRMKLELMMSGAGWTTVHIFVVYPELGRENAQKALNLVHKIFEDSDVKGANIAPSYNKKVTDLIYYAQGNRDDKVCKNFQIYFQKPDMIFYDHNKLPPESNYQTHELLDPASSLD